ncbi:MAG: hypothetical protein HY840_00200 [Bacteroidetes bacterium]|nr:hypothetical protein [Bacteroidota bacterium]
MRIILLFILIIIFCFFSCRKKSEVNIHGIVFSTGTGKGLPNIEVQFYTIKDKLFNDKCSYLITRTDANGNFSFSDVEIIDNKKYTYGLWVPYFSNSDYAMFGIGPIDIETGELKLFHSLGVTSNFKKLYILLPEDIHVLPPDSFTVFLENRYLHYYLPDNIWQLDFFPSEFHFFPDNFPTSYYAYIGVYPMGWWHLKFEKIKNGEQSVFLDSIYLGMGETKEYILPW